jgi:electron transfer flavoprotein alpha subunit
MNTLILVEHDNQQLHASTHHLLSAALLLDKSPVLLIVGSECHAVATAASTLAGVGAVWVADHPCYVHQLAENVSQLVASLATSFQAVIASSTTYGKNTLPRIAAMLDVAQVSDVTRIIDETTVEHPIYAGNALETVRLLDDTKIMTIRTTAFDAVTNQQSPCPIKSIESVFVASKTTFVSHALTESVRPELTQATRIVSGGRALQSAEKFKLIDELADVLGAAVGASRAAVDAGYVPNDCQVGQTGKIVAPLLYIAVGISGAVQHLAGMKDSKVIVAINKDADAPIFQVADYGLVGDLFVLVPELIEQLKR